MKLKNLLLSMLIIVAVKATAQDPQLSQYYSNPIMLNPAYAGGSEGPAIFMNYRNQWPGVGSSFITNTVAADIPVDKISGGFGLLVSSDKFYWFNNRSYSGSYAHALRLSENVSVRMGIEGSYKKRNISLNWFSPSPGINRNIETVDMASGLLLAGKNFNIGFAVHNLFEPEIISDFYYPFGGRKYTAHYSITLKSGKYNFSPHLLFMKQGNFDQYHLGCYIGRSIFSTGLRYRHTPNSPDVLIASLSIGKKYFYFGYSYDIFVSKLGMKTYGAHEFSIRGLIPGKKERKNLIPANNPVFSTASVD